MVRINARNLCTDILLSVGDGGRHVVGGSNFIDVISELLVCCRNVTRLQTDASPFLQTLIGFRRATTKDHHRVREEALRLIQLCIDQSVACPQQYDEHEDAPRYGKAGQRGAQLVAFRRLGYFFQ